MPVKRIVVDNARVSGVETEGGETFSSYTVISNADPKQTLNALVGARHFETGFANRVHHLRSRGNAGKLHLALDGLPTIAGIGKKDFGQRILIAGDEHYVERAFNPAKYGKYSTEPVIEITFPSVRDESLAPTGKHVMSAIVQYAPYGLRDGWSDESRDAFAQIVIATIAKYAPDIDQRITASELLTPVDIEQDYRVTGGHWHHTEFAMDQLMMMRPTYEAAQYDSPIPGLHLCSAACHPGGDLTGMAGHNAAQELLR